MGLKLITPAAEEPVSLDEAKHHLRVDHSDDDDLIALYIAASRQDIDGRDGWLGRALVSQTWELSLDRFPRAEIQLPFAPLQSVVSIKYYAPNGIEQTVSVGDYEVDAASEPGWVIPGTSGWPSTLDAINAVRVRFIAGYGDAADVPAPIKAAVLLRVGDLYANREAQMVGATGHVLNPTLQALLQPYRVWSV